MDKSLRIDLDKRLQILDDRTEQILNRLEQFDDEILRDSPSPEVWSPLEILSHVMMSEQLSLRYVQKKLGFQPTLRESSFITGIRSFILRLLLLAPIKTKAPPGVQSEDLPTILTLAELRQIWLAERNELQRYLSGISDDLLTREVYRHPLVGRLSLSQMIDFFDQHLKRHIKQVIKRLPSIIGTLLVVSSLDMI